MQNSEKPFTNWDKLRGTPAYNEHMLLILHGIINTAGLFETDEAIADYDRAKTMDDFRRFVRKWDTQHTIDAEAEIITAEAAYEELEGEPIEMTDKDDEGLTNLFRVLGEPDPDEALKELKRKRTKNKPKLN